MNNVISIKNKLQKKKMKDIDEKEKTNLSYLFKKSKELANQYIDGNFDDQFKAIYKQGAGGDDDFFGRSFAIQIVSYTVNRLRENKGNELIQNKIMKNFGLASKGLLDHIMKPVLESLKSQISDSLTGLDNYKELAANFNSEVQENNSYYESKKTIVENCFNPPIARLLRRIK